MDKRLRRNELCVIGLPRCDFAFSSTRTCFIGYGFTSSALETSILSKLLQARQVEPIEASGRLAPAQNAFCAKICSKIITSQFCVILLNNDLIDGAEVPNANVNMEYGLMLGFNKYVVPFQRKDQKLPFNVAGLDTIKYSDTDFEAKSIAAIDQAIRESTQEEVPHDSSDQLFQTFLLARSVVFSPIESEGERSIFRLGQPLGFNLLNDFSGDNYVFFGRFAALRPEAIVWRLRKFEDILNGRRSGIAGRVDAGLMPPAQVPLVERFFHGLRIWVAVTASEHKATVQQALAARPFTYPVDIFCVEDVLREIAIVSSEGAM